MSRDVEGVDSGGSRQGEGQCKIRGDERYIQFGARPVRGRVPFLAL